MALPVIMHVNYCEQGQSIDEICKKAVDWGFEGVEFRRKRAGASEVPEAYLDQIAKGVSRSGLKTVIFGSPGPNLAVADDRARESEIEAVVNFYRLAAERFKLSVCNTFAGNMMNPAAGVSYFECEKHGSFVASEDQWQYAADGFTILGRLAAELGFRFAFETHMCYIHDLPAPAKKLVDRINHPAVGVNLDYGNAVYFKNPPGLKETIGMLGERLYYVHLKNSVGASDGGRMPSGLGEGEINHRAYLKLLKEAGYDGPVCIEAPRAGDREWFAQADIAYLKSLMRDLEWS
jgi:sugar phosphate isomerase/epimerase